MVSYFGPLTWEHRDETEQLVSESNPARATVCPFTPLENLLVTEKVLPHTKDVTCSCKTLKYKQPRGHRQGRTCRTGAEPSHFRALISLIKPRLRSALSETLLGVSNTCDAGGRCSRNYSCLPKTKEMWRWVYPFQSSWGVTKTTPSQLNTFLFSPFCHLQQGLWPARGTSPFPCTHLAYPTGFYASCLYHILCMQLFFRS